MSTTPFAPRGFVYVATGKTYVDEAADSARSVRKFHREPICLITNEPVSHPEFDQVIVKPELRNDVSSKLAMAEAPFEMYLFLDSDTLIAAPLDEIWQLLEAFDVAVPASLGGYHYTLPGVSPAFREPSTNVIGFRRSPTLDEFFKLWKKYFDAYETEMGREWDQRSFRHAAYETRALRLCFLGDEWSLSPYPGAALCRDVRIFHGRPRPYLHVMLDQVNRRAGFRVFWRGFGVLYEPFAMKPSEYFRLLSYTLYQGARACIRTVFRRKKT